MSLTNLVDINPNLIAGLLSHNGLSILCEKLLGFDIDCVEWVVRCLEKISIESTNHILLAGGLYFMFNLFDFFEMHT